MNETIKLRGGGAWRGWKRGGFWCGLMLMGALAAPCAAEAATYRWQVDASGNWTDAANWAFVEGPAGAGYPNLPGDVAVFDEPLTAERTITIPDAVTIAIGGLTITSSNAAGKVTITRAGTGVLVFDNLGEDALIETSGPGQRTVMFLPVQLAAHLNINGAIDFYLIGETAPTRNVTITGGSVLFIQPNSYTGTTTVANGELSTSASAPGARIPGVLVVGDGTGAAASANATLIGESMAPSADVQVNADGRVTFGRTQVVLGQHTIDGLTVAGGQVRVAPAGSSSSSLTVQDVTMEGGEIELVFNASSLVLAGSLTATSNASGPAVVRAASTVHMGGLALPPGSHDFTITDGPQAVDFLIDRAPISGGATADLNKRGTGVMRIDGMHSFTGPTTVFAGRLLVDGNVSSSAFTVGADGVLGGLGTVGPVTTNAGGQVAPGAAPAAGTLFSGSVNLTGGELAIEINPTPGVAGSDQLQVTGTVTLNGAALEITATPVQVPPAMLTIIANDGGTDPVVGTFAGLPEGALVTFQLTQFRISYIGGDGNDVVLTNITPITYFLSEGATGTFFDEDVLIANPNPVAAPITMTFFLPGGGTIVQTASVPGLHRLTVDVDEIEGLGNTSPSVEVRSDNRLTLGVERTMFWDSTHYGGHTANSVPRAELQWFFAEGAQNDFFNTFLLLANPNGAMTAKVTFLRENEPPFVLDVPLQAQSRTTVSAGDHPELVGRSFGIAVEAPTPITAERAMYFATTPQRLWSGGHDNVGSPAPATSWFHPEGASGTFFSTFILMSNPQTSPANVTLRFLLESGAPIEITRTIEPQQRLTINPAAEGIAALQNASFSTVVTSDVAIVSERAMYWNTDDTAFGEGHASSGLTSLGTDWLLAEGRVGGENAYATYILLANPGSSAAEVVVSFLREGMVTPVVVNYTVPANSRFNIDVGTMVPELQNESFGAFIQVSSGPPIAVERSMYWNVEGRFWSGGTNAVGAVVPR